MPSASNHLGDSGRKQNMGSMIKDVQPENNCKWRQFLKKKAIIGTHIPKKLNDRKKQGATTSLSFGCNISFIQIKAITIVPPVDNPITNL